MNSFFDTSHLKADRMLKEHADQLLAINWNLDSEQITGSWSHSDTESVMNSEKITMLLNHWSNRGYGLWVLSQKITGQIIGLAGYQTTMMKGKEEVEVIAIFLKEFCNQENFTEIGCAIFEKTPEWELPLDSVLMIASDRTQIYIQESSFKGLNYESEVEIHDAVLHVYRLNF